MVAAKATTGGTPSWTNLVLVLTTIFLIVSVGGIASNAMAVTYAKKMNDDDECREIQKNLNRAVLAMSSASLILTVTFLCLRGTQGLPNSAMQRYPRTATSLTLAAAAAAPVAFVLTAIYVQRVHEQSPWQCDERKTLNRGTFGLTLACLSVVLFAWVTMVVIVWKLRAVVAGVHVPVSGSVMEKVKKSLADLKAKDKPTKIPA